MEATYKQIDKSIADVAWEWFDKEKGEVKWTLTNNSESQKSVVLLRNSYYFGNAFWPVYKANGMSDFTMEASPLEDKGTQDNSAPLFIGKVNGKYLVAFLFTLSAKQSWSIIEGGFIGGFEPSNFSLKDVSSMELKEMSVGYDEKQVTDWDAQTGTDYKGYEPNPTVMKVLVGNIDGPYIQLFDDPIVDATEHPDCDAKLKMALSYMADNKMSEGIVEFLAYLDCLLGLKLDKEELIVNIIHKL